MTTIPEAHSEGSDPCGVVHYLLVLKCSSDVCQDEVDGVAAVTSLLGMQPIYVDKARGENIFQKTKGHCFRAVYVAGHGDHAAIGEQQGACQRWDDLAAELCAAACMQEDSVVFCACCYGGLRATALSFFRNCPNVESVCGPTSSISPASIFLAFHVILHGVYFGNSSVDMACRRATDATQHCFTVHSQQEALSRGEVNLLP